MKKIRIIGLMIILSLTFNHVFGQGDMENLIKGSISDANYLVKGYTAPVFKALGSGLNQGWYNTAQNHKFPGADLTISVAMIGVPSSDKVFKVDNNTLQQITLTSPTNLEVPTIFGKDVPPSTYSLDADGTGNTTFSGPPGFDLPISRVPIPVANLGIGLPKGFDLKIRFIPNINLQDDLELGLFGIGVMHDIKQYIPGIKTLPFDLAAFVGYTKFKSKVTLDAATNQTSEFDVSATTIQVLISKKMAVLTVYGGLGYDISKGGLAMKGAYDFDDDGTTDATNPIDFSVTTNSPRVTAGLRLKLGPITFHGDYTLQKYSAITAGFGISVR